VNLWKLCVILASVASLQPPLHLLLINIMKSDSPESKKTTTPESELSEKSTFKDYLKATEQKANQPLPIWRLVVPLLVQVGLIMSVPTHAAYTDVTGKTVILQTLPVDSSDVMQNSALAFDYNISRISTLRKVNGWGYWARRHALRNGQINEGSTLYLILQERLSLRRNSLRAWKPIRVSSNLPNNLFSNQVALKGNYQDGMIDYGLDNYSIPETEREQVSRKISQEQENRSGEKPPILVKVKVDPQGNAVPVSFTIGDRSYRF